MPTYSSLLKHHVDLGELERLHPDHLEGLARWANRQAQEVRDTEANEPFLQYINEASPRRVAEYRKKLEDCLIDGGGVVPWAHRPVGR